MNIKRLWKQLGAWGTVFRNKLRGDIFETARAKITFLYLAMGALILGVAGYLIYTRMIILAEDIVGTVTSILASKGPIDPAVASTIIVNSINRDLRSMNLTVGILALLALIISAYVFAGITLRPLRKTMERQKRFIANVSHELRTPLAVMKTGTEVTLMEAPTLSRDELVSALASNAEEVNRLTRITQFLLEFSNAEDRLSHIVFTPVDLAAAVNNALELVKKNATEKNVHITFDRNGPAMMRGNAVALEEMTLNILKNAVAYTPPEGSVSVAIEQPYGEVRLSVSDTGIGIPEEDLPRLFEPFHRGRNATHLRKGSGLGLTIVKEIADLHSAAISVKSVLGRGTTFAVSFPSH